MRGGNIEACSRMFNLGKVDVDKLTCLPELNPFAFCILSLVHDNFLERRLLFKKAECTEKNLKNLKFNTLFRV